MVATSVSKLPEMWVSIAARTDVGMRRAGNEDNLQVVDLTEQRLGLTHREATLSPDVAQHRLGPLGTLLIVSDGMGGAAAGEVASEMAVEIVSREMTRRVSAGLASLEAMRLAADSANMAIWDRSQNESAIRGLGATLTAVHLSGREAVVSQVGDSRAYLIRGGTIRQLTEDQSWVNAAKKAGMQVANVPNNVILQALGTQRAVNADITIEGFQPNDIFLLCSDGLSNKVEAQEMLAVVSTASSLDAAAEALVKLANDRGGEDNITVVIAQLVPSAAGDACAPARATQMLASAASSGDTTLALGSSRSTAELQSAQTLSGLGVATQQPQALPANPDPATEIAAGSDSAAPSAPPALSPAEAAPQVAAEPSKSGRLFVFLALIAVAGIVLVGVAAMVWILQARTAASRDLINIQDPSPVLAPAPSGAPLPVAAPEAAPASSPSSPSGIGRAAWPLLDEVEEKLQRAEKEADGLARRLEGLSGAKPERERAACREKRERLKQLRDTFSRHRRQETKPDDLSVAEIEREVAAISKWLDESLPLPRKPDAPNGKPSRPR